MAREINNPHLNVKFIHLRANTPVEILGKLEAVKD